MDMFSDPAVNACAKRTAQNRRSQNDWSAPALSKEDVEKIFQFAFRRIGNRHDAEDLAQDIAVEVTNALARGAAPTHFHGWLWTVARNRYSRWLNKKKRLSGGQRSETDLNGCAAEIGGTEAERLSDQSMTPEEQYIYNEQIAAVQRELARLSQNYRDIVVLFYLYEKTVKEIAAMLGLAEGTVKRRLHEAREMIRERMVAVRSNGTKSYAPDHLSLVASGSPNRTWSYVQRLLPKNILSAAGSKPVTIDELCDEIGLARPYMEEEVGLLLEAQLLRRAGKDKVQADIVILDEEPVADVRRKVFEWGQQLGGDIMKALNEKREEILAVDFYGAAFPWEKLLWTLILKLADRVAGAAPKLDLQGLPPYEKEWAMVGTRMKTAERGARESGRHDKFYGHDVNWFRPSRLYSKIAVGNYYNFKELPKRHDLIDEQMAVLLARLKDETVGADDLGENDRERVSELIVRGLVRKDGETLRPELIVFTEAQYRELLKLLDGIAAQLTEVPAAIQQYALKKLKPLVPAHLHNQLPFVIDGHLYLLRNAIVHYATEKRYLRWPEDPKTCTEAMYMRLI
jgi:RNA polymerase sigma-70 factor (ECF subfamily)